MYEMIRCPPKTMHFFKTVGIVFVCLNLLINTNSVTEITFFPRNSGGSYKYVSVIIALCCQATNLNDLFLLWLFAYLGMKGLKRLCQILYYVFL